MRLFKVPLDRKRARASELLSRRSRGERKDWAYVCLSGVWKALEDWERAPSPELLDEAESGLQQLLGAVDSLRLP